MCTVTFIPVKDRCYITSNRDEKISRKPAIPPASYLLDDQFLLYPKDADAGGSWIALSDNRAAGVLLNGGFAKHVPAASYRRSRGLIFLELMSSTDAAAYFLEMDLRQIEPFTVVLLHQEKLYECRWDGKAGYCREINRSIPHIWSSVTLYDAAVIKKREEWFAQWLQINPYPEQKDILEFHCFAGEGDLNHDLVMNRRNEFLTVSITSIEVQEGRGMIEYLDMANGQRSRSHLNFISSHILQ